MTLQISAGLDGNHSGKGCVFRVPEPKSRAETLVRSSSHSLREVRVGLGQHLVPLRCVARSQWLISRKMAVKGEKARKAGGRE